MTARKRIKDINSKLSIQDVANTVDRPVRTIENWYKSDRRLFEACLLATLLNKL